LARLVAVQTETGSEKSLLRCSLYSLMPIHSISLVRRPARVSWPDHHGHGGGGDVGRPLRRSEGGEGEPLGRGRPRDWPISTWPTRRGSARFFRGDTAKDHEGSRGLRGLASQSQPFQERERPLRPNCDDEEEMELFFSFFVHFLLFTFSASISVAFSLFSVVLS